MCLVQFCRKDFDDKTNKYFIHEFIKRSFKLSYFMIKHHLFYCYALCVCNHCSSGLKIVIFYFSDIFKRENAVRYIYNLSSTTITSTTTAATSIHNRKTYLPTINVKYRMNMKNVCHDVVVECLMIAYI